MTGVTRAADGTVTGNTYDKYGTRNPVARALQRGFERNLHDLFASVEPSSLLDVGCGEGVLTQRWALELDPRRVVGIDLADPLIAAEWERHGAPNLTYIAQRAISASECAGSGTCSSTSIAVTRPNSPSANGRRSARWAM